MEFLFLIATIGLVLGLKFMGDPAKAVLGNAVAAISVVVALVGVAITSYSPANGAGTFNIVLVVCLLAAGGIIGRVMAMRVPMTGMPQLVAMLNGFGGLAAVVIALIEGIAHPIGDDMRMNGGLLLLSAVFGGVAFTGSLVAHSKLEGKKLPKARPVHIVAARIVLWAMVALVAVYMLAPGPIMPFTALIVLVAVLSLVYGALFTLPIGGADMPVLICFLVALHGVVALLAGLFFQDTVMLIGGVLVGATGSLLTIAMSKAMNRSLANVLKGVIKRDTGAGEREQDIRPISAAETASLLAFSRQVAVIPGYGMAVSQAQGVCQEMQVLLERMGAVVHYIIHPVAGRMPGHMNVLLAEANVDYDLIMAMEDVNDVMDRYDAVLVIGANDVVNPAAESDPASSIHGMPIIRAYAAKQVIVLKRGMATGYSGEVNLLFDRANCRLLFGDARASLRTIIDELKRI
ncbi:MAG: NAD(P)(+) transhydrogenase (Re/Si-specific) subunit beta [Flavobacteriales bacterium]|jgi:NAD(P) transhydrogenase subunit beta|nr:NAD(P)(+) transhydrogenase (Re/Si-specific) subunit beta [Flavobacteriales bacterium]